MGGPPRPSEMGTGAEVRTGAGCLCKLPVNRRMSSNKRRGFTGDSAQLTTLR